VGEVWRAMAGGGDTHADDAAKPDTSRRRSMVARARDGGPRDVLRCHDSMFAFLCVVRSVAYLFVCLFIYILLPSLDRYFRAEARARAPARARARKIHFSAGHAMLRATAAAAARNAAARPPGRPCKGLTITHCDSAAYNRRASAGGACGDRRLHDRRYVRLASHRIRQRGDVRLGNALEPYAAARHAAL
jgi:hypothetical protein